MAGTYNTYITRATIITRKHQDERNTLH